MKKYICEPCGYEYDPAIGAPDGGIAVCGLGKDVFVPAED